MVSLIRNYNARFEQAIAQVKLGATEGGEIRDAIIIENFNWVNWHMPSVILPSIIEVMRIINQHLPQLRKEKYVKEFIQEVTNVISTPSLRSFLDSRYEGKVRDSPSENKPSYEQELELKQLYGQLITLLIN